MNEQRVKRLLLSPKLELMDSLIGFLEWSCSPAELLLRLESVSIDRRRGLIMRLRGAAADQSQPQSAFMSHTTSTCFKTFWKEIVVFFGSLCGKWLKFTLLVLKCFLSSDFWLDTCSETTPDAENASFYWRKSFIFQQMLSASFSMFNVEVHDSLEDWWEPIRDATMHRPRFGSSSHLNQSMVVEDGWCGHVFQKTSYASFSLKKTDYNQIRSHFFNHSIKFKNWLIIRVWVSCLLLKLLPFLLSEQLKLCFWFVS